MPITYFDDEIRKASGRYSVPESVIRAVIQIESSWNPRAYRPEPTSTYCVPGSYGLMQLCPATARQMGWGGGNNQELYDPAVNINLGTAYLRFQASRYSNDWVDAVAAYNAGSVRKNSNGTYINQAHVNKFIKAWNQYGGQTPPVVTPPPLPPYSAPVYDPEKKTPIIPTQEVITITPTPTLWCRLKEWLRQITE